MDAVAVLSMANWIMGELVRVYHGLNVTDAQQVVDALAEVRIPMIWSDGFTKRVLQPSLTLREQLVLLIASTLPHVSLADLKDWSEASDKKYFIRLLRGLHKKRWIELNESTGIVRILPPGTSEAKALLQRKASPL